MGLANDFFEPEKVYHIYSKAVGNELIFLSDENFKYFLKRYDEYCSEIFETLAYCLIPNHFHLLVRIKEGRPNEVVVKKFSDFLNSYSKAFNKLNGRSGSLFQRKLKRKEIKNEEYFTRIILYIHLNPVKHQVVKNLDSWMYSSYHSYLSDKPSKIKRELALEWFGGGDEFEKIHNEIKNEYLPQDLMLE